MNKSYLNRMLLESFPDDVSLLSESEKFNGMKMDWMIFDDGAIFYVTTDTNNTTVDKEKK